MYRLIESIKVNNGELCNLVWHQERVKISLSELGAKHHKILLNEIVVPSEAVRGIYKCRIVYDESGIHSCTFEAYKSKQINKLKLVYSEDIDYSLKWENRDVINSLFAQRGSADDIIIVKNNKITDSSYANLLFKKDKQWFTPAQPLLRGIIRNKLLSESKIIPMDISYTDVVTFESCKLINAMLEFDGPEIAVTDIVL
jgi:4-amino-4-deoxychorismate lyase